MYTSCTYFIECLQQQGFSLNLVHTYMYIVGGIYHLPKAGRALTHDLLMPFWLSACCLQPSPPPPPPPLLPLPLPFSPSPSLPLSPPLYFCSYNHTIYELLICRKHDKDIFPVFVYIDVLDINDISPVFFFLLSSFFNYSECH